MGIDKILIHKCRNERITNIPRERHASRYWMSGNRLCSHACSLDPMYVRRFSFSTMYQPGYLPIPNILYVSFSISKAYVNSLAIITNALGVGFSASIRSLATSLVEPDQVGRLYAAIATFDMIGGLVAGPTLSSVYSWGLGRGGGWVGAPYLLAGVMYCGIAICVWGFRVRRLE